MDLKEIRKEIDATDDEILRLFLKRMDLCVGVAKYKKENNMQVSARSSGDSLFIRSSISCSRFP